MEDGLIYTDSRPRAKSTGHAFGFQGNLGMPVIVAALFSVFLLTILFSGNNQLPVMAKFSIALMPLVLTTGYVIVFKNRRPPSYDRDLLISVVNGSAFRGARLQPHHPYLFIK